MECKDPRRGVSCAALDQAILFVVSDRADLYQKMLRACVAAKWLSGSRWTLNTCSCTVYILFGREHRMVTVLRTLVAIASLHNSSFSYPKSEHIDCHVARLGLIAVFDISPGLIPFKTRSAACLS